MLTREDFQTTYEQGPDAVFSSRYVTLQAQIDTACKRELKELRRPPRTKTAITAANHPQAMVLPKSPCPCVPHTGRKLGGQKGHPGKTLVADRNARRNCCPYARPMRLLRSAFSRSRRRTGRAATGFGRAAAAPVCHRTSKPAQNLRRLRGGHLRGVSRRRFANRAVRPPRQSVGRVPMRPTNSLPYHRIAGLFADLFGAPLSPGTLFATQQAGAENLSAVLADIKDGLQKAAVVHFDETGLRVGGKLRWLHSAGNLRLDLLRLARAARQRRYAQQAGVLSGFAGTAVHDGWASYFHYGCRHALCNAHHLRELTALHEQDKQDNGPLRCARFWWKSKTRSERRGSRARSDCPACLSVSLRRGTRNSSPKGLPPIRRPRRRKQANAGGSNKVRRGICCCVCRRA